jgi:hypothetical protein
LEGLEKHGVDFLSHFNEFGGEGEFSIFELGYYIEGFFNGGDGGF